MTALAMIIGMIPMALGLGEGGEQNAPLGRAVIGGLLFATVSTLFFVPVVYAGVHSCWRTAARAPRRRPRRSSAGLRRLEQCPSNATRHWASTRSPRRRARAAQARQIVRRARDRVLVVLVLLALGAARTVFSRIANAHALEAGTAERAKQYVQDRAAQDRRRRPDAGAAGHAAGLRAGADLGARQRLPEALDQGHRQPRREGRAAGRDRDAGDRPAAVAGDRGARSRPPPSLELAKSTVERWEGLRKKDVVSQQELDERRSAVAQAARQPGRGRRQRASGCARLEGFKRVRRAVRRRDHAAQRRRRRPDRRRRRRRRALFLLAQTDPLRVYVNVPQAYAQLVKAGPAGGRDAGRAARPELQGRGRAHRGVDRHRHAHDAGRGRAAQPRRRAAAGRLRAGLAAAGGQPARSPFRPTRCCSAPRARAWRWSMREGTVQLRTVQLGRNYGETVEVLDGIGATDRLVLNPSDSLAEGDVVAIAPAAKEAAREGAAALPRRRVAALARAAGRLRRRARLPHAGASTCRSSWKVEAPWRQGTPERRAPTRARGGSASATPQLDALQQQALADSPTLALAGARLAQARATLAGSDGRAATRSSALGARAPRFKISANRPLTNYSAPNFSTVQNDFALSLTASYEVDLAGRVQRSIEGATRLRRAVGRRPREHAAAAHRRPGHRTTSTCARSTSSSTCWRARSRCSAARSSW